MKVFQRHRISGAHEVSPFTNELLDAVGVEPLVVRGWEYAPGTAQPDTPECRSAPLPYLGAQLVHPPSSGSKIAATLLKTVKEAARNLGISERTFLRRAGSPKLNKDRSVNKRDLHWRAY